MDAHGLKAEIENNSELTAKEVGEILNLEHFEEFFAEIEENKHRNTKIIIETEISEDKITFYAREQKADYVNHLCEDSIAIAGWFNEELLDLSEETLEKLTKIIEKKKKEKIKKEIEEKKEKIELEEKEQEQLKEKIRELVCKRDFLSKEILENTNSTGKIMIDDKKYDCTENNTIFTLKEIETIVNNSTMHFENVRDALASLNEQNEKCEITIEREWRCNNSYVYYLQIVFYREKANIQKRIGKMKVELNEMALFDAVDEEILKKITLQKENIENVEKLYKINKEIEIAESDLSYSISKTQKLEKEIEELKQQLKTF